MGIRLKKESLGPGTLHFLGDEKFKTVHLRLFLSVPLGDQAAATALIPALLKRGTQDHPDMTAISRFLEDLYGASLGCSVSKSGENQLLLLDLNLPSDRYLPKGEDTLRKGIQFLKEVITRPREENGSFPQDVFLQERENQKRYVEGLLNDKRAFAMERCVKEMCGEEPYGISTHGDPEQIGALEGAEVWHRFQEVKGKGDLKFFAAGALEEGVLREEVESLFQALGERESQSNPAVSVAAPESPRRIEEEIEVNQGKLVLGYRADVGISDAALDGLTLFSALFGGGTSSRLFRKVREEKSLAYYAMSSLEKIKGLMFVQAGINAENLESCLETMAGELESLKKGEIEEKELAEAKRQLINSFRSIPDSPGGLIGFGMSSELTGRRRSVEEVMEGIEKTSVAKIVEAGQGVKLDTIYFLKPKSS